MKTNSSFSWRQLLSMLLLIALSGCATPRIWLAQQGQVLEWPSQKPIEGAVVVALWKGSIPIIPADSMSTCYHVESATTDAQGRYWLPAFAEGPGRVIDRHIMSTVYKAGYRESIDERGFYRERDGVHYLEKDTGTREERLEYLLHLPVDCGGKDGSDRHLLQIRKALYEEANTLARTKDEMKTVEYLLFYLEIIELGYESALKRHLERP